VDIGGQLSFTPTRLLHELLLLLLPLLAVVIRPNGRTFMVDP